MRPRRINIPSDLTDIVDAEVDFSPLNKFVAEVKQTLRDNDIDDSQISIPDTRDMVMVKQKPELLREVIVGQENRISNLESNNV